MITLMASRTIPRASRLAQAARTLAMNSPNVRDLFPQFKLAAVTLGRTQDRLYRLQQLIGGDGF